MTLPSGAWLRYRASSLDLSDGDTVTGWANEGDAGSKADLDSGSATYHDTPIGPAVAADDGAFLFTTWDPSDSPDALSAVMALHRPADAGTASWIFGEAGLQVDIVADVETVAWRSNDSTVKATGGPVDVGFAAARLSDDTIDVHADCDSASAAATGVGFDVSGVFLEGVEDADDGPLFAEVVVWDRRLSDAEFRQARTHLSDAYGLALSCVTAPPLRLKQRDDDGALGRPVRLKQIGAARQSDPVRLKQTHL